MCTVMIFLVKLLNLFFWIESLLEANSKALDIKASILEEDNKLNEAMEREIQLLTNGPDRTKVCS